MTQYVTAPKPLVTFCAAIYTPNPEFGIDTSNASSVVDSPVTTSIPFIVVEAIVSPALLSNDTEPDALLKLNFVTELSEIF